MAPSVEKKIAELEMGLLHLQQNIEIPEISLLIHPIISNVAKQCYERGEKPKVTDFGDKVEDPTFLNQLQSGVNRWIREIQKVHICTLTTLLYCYYYYYSKHTQHFTTQYRLVLSVLINRAEMPHLQ